MSSSEQSIQMVDLRGQYDAIKAEVDSAIRAVVNDTAFINGPAVASFERELGTYLGGTRVTGVANGTDAIQVALMALGIGPGDEVITPSFTFVATAEAVALLGATPVFGDIRPDTFNLDPEALEPLISENTKAIVPVHLFGQPAQMDAIMDVAERHDLYVVEDAAQAVGARFKEHFAGTIGHYGTLSFFPSKNLGAYGDGGAVLSRSLDLQDRVRLIANHGSSKKYHNVIVGVNSRLDAMQAAVLSVKLKHLNAYTTARQAAAERYDDYLSDFAGIATPVRDPDCSHVFHQYTIRVLADSSGPRDALASHLGERGIPHAVYYPVPMHKLPVFADQQATARWNELPATEQAARQVLSLPMHTELTEAQQAYIAESIGDFVEGH